MSPYRFPIPGYVRLIRRRASVFEVVEHVAYCTPFSVHGPIPGKARDSIAAESTYGRFRSEIVGGHEPRIADLSLQAKIPLPPLPCCGCHSFMVVMGRTAATARSAQRPFPGVTGTDSTRIICHGLSMLTSPVNVYRGLNGGPELKLTM